MTPQAFMEESPAVKPMGEVSRMLGVFFEPKATFKEIVARPRWWPPLVLLVLFSLAFSYAFSQRIGYERIIRQTFESNQRMQNLPPEQREQMLERMTQFMGYSYAISALGRPIALLIGAAALLFVINTLGSVQTTYVKALAITSYAFLPAVITTILSIVMVFLKPAEDFNIRNPLAFNLGFFLSSSTWPAWVMPLANAADLFSFWTMALLATGFSVAAKMPWSKALFGVMTVWFIYLVFAVVGGVLSS